jgi:hypothetical protein
MAMKKTIAFILVMVVTFALGGVTTAFAETDDTDYTALLNASSSMQEEPLLGYTVGVSVPGVRGKQIADPNETYSSLMELSEFREAVLLKDDEPVGSASFFEIGGEWVCTDFVLNGTKFSDAIAKYGSDTLYIAGYMQDAVVESKEPHMVHPVVASYSEAADTEWLLSEYVVCTSYLTAHQTTSTGTLGGDYGIYDVDYETAKAYWERNPFSQDDQDSNASPWIAIGIAVVVIAAGVVVWVIIRRKKKMDRAGKEMDAL